MGLREVFQRRKQQRQQEIDQRLGELHRRGHEIAARIEAERMDIHEARRLAAAWIESVYDYVKTNVSVSLASVFLGDFGAIKKTWQQRRDDKQLKPIDETIQFKSEAMIQEVITTMKEKLARLEEIMKR